jgi:release factor glutamine methyltransferase
MTISPDDSFYRVKTVQQAVRKVLNVLVCEGIDEAHLEADLLVAHVLGISRTELLARFPDAFPEGSISSLMLLVNRRCNREPLAYLIGWREFYGLCFTVRSGVLIPRQETETLVDEVIRVVRERYGYRSLIADVGCGCGAIAVSLAVHLPQSRIYAVDSNPVALDLTALNSDKHNVRERIAIDEGDLLSPVDKPVETVVANLPYIRSRNVLSLQAEVLHEPQDALDGGYDGLQVIRRLLKQLPQKLASGGALLLECDPDQAGVLADEVGKMYPKSELRILKDLTRRDRVVEAFF